MKVLVVWLFLTVLGACESVVELNADNFDTFITTENVSMVAFINPSCQYCQELEPEYDRAGKGLVSQGIAFGRVNCEEHKPLCKRYEAIKYPTLLAFEGDSSTLYTGLRKANSIVPFMKRYNRPLVTSLDGDQSLLDLGSRDDVSIIASINSDDSESLRVFRNVAKTYRGMFLFGLISDRSSDQLLEIGTPSIVIYKPFEERENAFEGSFDEQSLTDFVTKSTTPKIYEIGKDVAKVRSSVKFSAIFLVVAKHNQRDLVDSLYPLAAEAMDGTMWFVVDPIEFPEYTSRLSIDPAQCPVIGVEHEGDVIATAQLTNGANAMNEAIVREVLAVLRSEQRISSARDQLASTGPSGSVINVSAETYNLEVVDSPQDVLMLFYSPTCRHCKAMIPEYQKLADLLVPYQELIKVAQIDATSHTMEPRPSKFPTIKLFRSDNKGDPVEYKGSRSASDFVRFIKHSGSAKVVLALSAGDVARDEL